MTKMRHARRWLFGGLALLMFTVMAGAQDVDEGVMIDVNVNYRLGYRDGTWVPVDVVVNNHERDFEGYVEVRTYSGDQLQSPIYRVEATSPESSKKRFRLHCRLKQATRLEAMMYHKNKPVLPVPAFITLQPISPKDYLGLVLDDEPTDYGFLNAAFAFEKHEDRSVRFYREEVSTGALPLLADFPQCYSPYDVVILGDVDQSRISARHRAILKRYVLEGGVMIVCTGENAGRLRGSWVEELSGVSIGAVAQTDGAALSEKVFVDEKDRAGAKANRKGMLAELTPRAPEVQVRGEDVVLATLRPLGSGYVITLAVDAASHLLQDTEGFRRLWRDACVGREARNELNYSAATQLYVDRLPFISGITLFSKSSVMLYLFLYFAIGIVGNWFVCNAFKRRELAWLLLVVFSAAFTAYAMIFGTAGRAKSSRIDQMEVLRVSRDGGSSELHSVVGVIAARSSNMSLGLVNQYSLAEDVATVNPKQFAGRYEPPELRPFFLNEDAEPTVSGFKVGASELRLVEVHTETRVTGGVEGSLALSDEGLSGVLTNQTGCKLTDASILLNGVMHATRIEDAKIVVESKKPQPAVSQEPPAADPRLARLRSRQGFNSRSGVTMPPGRGDEDALRSWEERERKALRSAFLDKLFARDVFEAGVDTQLGPFLVAWVEGGPLGALEPETPIEEQYGATVLVADIDVTAPEENWENYRGLSVRIEADPWGYYPKPGTYAWHSGAYQAAGPGGRGRRGGLSRLTTLSADIQLPANILRMEPKEMIVRVSVTMGGGTNVVFEPKGVGPDWAQKHRADVNQDYIQEEGVFRFTSTYRIEDWRKYLDESSGALNGQIRFEGVPGGNAPVLVGLSAEVLTTRSALANEEWKPWR